MILPIVKYPQKILLTNCAEVAFPLSPAVRKLAQDMSDTVRAADGIGIAAPQVGQALRLIIINLEHLGIPIFALANPKIIRFGKTESSMEEGCLSIPGVFGIVSRPEKIVFSGRDLNGKIIKAKAAALLARVIQHEIDHINGILIIDKIKEYTKGRDLLKIK